MVIEQIKSIEHALPFTLKGLGNHSRLQRIGLTKPFNRLLNPENAFYRLTLCNDLIKYTLVYYFIILFNGA